MQKDYVNKDGRIDRSVCNLKQFGKFHGKTLLIEWKNGNVLERLKCE